MAPAVGAGLQKASGGAISAPRAMFGHLVVTDGLSAELGAELASPEEASQAARAAEAQLAVSTS